jgi:nucleoside-diphosphate-sugar epimerase
MSFWKQFRRVLVTGGASFIGSHLVERLVSKGLSVRVADDLSSGRLENLEKVRKEVEFLQGDLRDLSFANKAAEGSEIVFHLAARHGGRGYIDTHPVECCTNMIIDGNTFAAVCNAGVERVCFASSACVYPINLQDKPDKNNALVSLTEEMADPLVPGRAYPDREYGWAKLMGELTQRAYYKQHGIKGVSCRLFTAYGDRENETHAVIALIAKAFVRMNPYLIWGSGEQDRNFTHVDDIVEGMLLAVEKVTDTSPVNIGTEEHIKIKQLAEMIFILTDFRPKALKFDVTKPIGVFSRAADLSRTRKVLEWEPKISLTEGLRRTVDWYFSTHQQEIVRKTLETKLREN